MDGETKDDKSTSSYSGAMSGTPGRSTWVAGTGGAKLRDYSAGPWPQWSVARDDKRFGYVKLTADDHSSLRVEFIHSESATSRRRRRARRVQHHQGLYKDILECTVDSCAPHSMAIADWSVVGH